MPIKIYAVGDIMLGEQPLCNNFGVSSVIKRKSVDYLFSNVQSIFDDGDIVFGNLECSIPNKRTANEMNSKFFYAEPDVIEGIKNAGFNALSVANNHIMEHGATTFRDTVELLRDNGIHPVGVSDDIEIISIRGSKIAFMAYSFIEDNIPNPCYNKIQSEGRILKDIKKIRSFVDIIIISLHWGCEYVPYPSPEQIQIGRKLIDAGADIILGGHPHVTQSYEIYNHKPIIYSLGNFIFDQTYISTTRESFIAKISISDTSELINVSIIPFIVNKSDYRPQLLNPPQSVRCLHSVNEVRKMVENHSIPELQAYLGDYGVLYEKYRKDAKRQMKVHFLKSIYHYSPSTILFTIKKSLGK